jgi:hypothetical protein
VGLFKYRIFESNMNKTTSLKWVVNHKVWLLYQLTELATKNVAQKKIKMSLS